MFSVNRLGLNMAMTRGEKLERLLERRGTNPARMAKQLGVAKQSVLNWIAGTRPQDGNVWAEMANILKVDVSELEADDQPPAIVGTEQAAPKQLLRTRAAETGRIKVYGPVSAGSGNTVNVEPGEMDVPIELAREDYGAMVIDGDSMMPFLHPSDTTVYRDWTYPKVGHVMIAKLSSGDWVTKLVVHESGQFKLRSLDTRYNDIEKDFTLCGYLVGIIRDDDDGRLIRINAQGLKPRLPGLTAE